MYRRWIKFVLPLLLWMGSIPGFVSCGFMDLRPIGMSTVPRESGVVLPDYYSPVILRFDTGMEKPGTERILQVSSGASPTEGDLHWEGEALYFVPLGGWKPGTRYTLSLSGTVYSLDGRELRLAEYIPFFGVSTAPAPRVVSVNPVDGGSAAVRTGDGTLLELHFSLPMDRRSAELAFSLEGGGDKRFEWLEDDQTLRVSSKNALAPWTLYRWSVNASARSRDGVPLVKTFSGQFITDADRLIPQVLKVFPMRRNGETWQPRGDSLEGGPGPGEGIGVEFNKPMEEDSVLRSLRFEPSLLGRVEQLSLSSIIFIPQRDPEPETVYTLRVSGDTQDTVGLKMGADYQACFTPDIPRLKIVSLTIDGIPAIAAEDPVQGASPAPVDIPGGKVLRFALKFSLPFSPEAMVSAALGISLDPFFPETLPPVNLRFAYWFSDDSTLRMEWEGLEPGTGGEAHYYRLNIPGGRNGIGTGGGSFLKEGRSFYLEAVQK